MITKTMTYEGFDGPITDTFYFKLTKAQVIELEASEEGGFSAMLQRVVDSRDPKLIIDTMKRFVLMAYGQRSPDGRRFIKSEQLREEFEQTEAFSDLFMELATNATAAAEFVNGIMPSDLQQSVDDIHKAVLEAQTPTPAQTPVAPAPQPDPVIPQAQPSEEIVFADNAPAATEPEAFDLEELRKKHPKDLSRDELIALMQDKNSQ